MHERRRSAGIVAGVLLAGVVAMGSPGDAVRAEDGDDVLRIAVLNAAMNNQSPLLFSGWQDMALTYDMLVGRDPSGEATPGFLESWSVDPDGVSWTLKVRPGMSWSDGEPATAADAAFTLNYVSDNKMFLGEGGGPFWIYFNVADCVDSATAVDDLTVSVTVLPGCGDWLTLSRAFVIPEHLWKDVDPTAAIEDYQPDLPLVGTGPYVLSETVAGQFRRFVRNEHYWGPTPAASEVLLVTYATEDGVAQALRAGEADAAMQVGLTMASDLGDDPNIHVVTAESNNALEIGFNTRGLAGGGSTDALADPAFRRALDYAFDRALVIDRVYQGLADPGQSLLAPANAAYFTDLGPALRTFDPAEAASQLDAAGYPLDANGARVDHDGKPILLKFVLNTGSNETIQASQFVVSWLAELGITASPVALEVGAYYQTLYAPDFDITLAKGNYDPGIFSLLNATSNQNYSGYANPEIDALYKQLIQSLDPAEQKDLATQITELYYADAPFLTLAYPRLIQAYREDRFSGWLDPARPDGPIMWSFSWPLGWPARVVVASETPSAAPSASAAPSPSSEASSSPVASQVPDANGDDGGSSGLPLVIAGGAAVVVIGGGLLAVRRRRAA